jgi:hypothetical protein
LAKEELRKFKEGDKRQSKETRSLINKLLNNVLRAVETGDEEFSERLLQAVIHCVPATAPAVNVPA